MRCALRPDRVRRTGFAGHLTEYHFGVDGGGVRPHTSHFMSRHPDPEKVREFLDAFEEVFDRDWVYTKQQLGIQDETEERKRACAEAGLVSIPFISDDGTFVHPKVEDEVNDWGNRARLLQAYRALTKDMP